MVKNNGMYFVVLQINENIKIYVEHERESYLNKTKRILYITYQMSQIKQFLNQL